MEQDVNLIREFCGEDEENHVLEDIAFTTDHKFQNDCRSPPWRQIHGDISYIEVKPHDEDPFYVTANTTGYFVNKVYLQPEGIDVRVLSPDLLWHKSSIILHWLTSCQLCRAG